MDIEKLQNEAKTRVKIDSPVDYIKNNEGYAQYFYYDNKGYTAGWGHLFSLDELVEILNSQQPLRELSDLETRRKYFEKLFYSDFEEAYQLYKAYADCVGDYYMAVVDLFFNMGSSFKNKFPSFWRYIKNNEFDKASFELLLSDTSKGFTEENFTDYFKQTKARAYTNACLLNERLLTENPKKVWSEIYE